MFVFSVVPSIVLDLTPSLPTDLSGPRSLLYDNVGVSPVVSDHRRGMTSQRLVSEFKSVFSDTLPGLPSDRLLTVFVSFP